MSSHGHVIPNADGSRARCGGPGLCAVCSREAAQELPRLRAELAKARAERDEARMEVIDSPFCDEALSQQARAERAEAELARVRDDRDALHAEFDGTRAELAQAWGAYDQIAARYNEQARIESEHCKDCCCARSWDALGVESYTGKSIPEHIESLRDRIAELEGELETAQRERDEIRARSIRRKAEHAAERERREAAEAVIHTCQWAMRQPLDGWKGECERKALDEARAHFARHEKD